MISCENTMVVTAEKTHILYNEESVKLKGMMKSPLDQARSYRRENIPVFNAKKKGIAVHVKGILSGGGHMVVTKRWSFFKKGILTLKTGIFSQHAQSSISRKQCSRQ